MNDFEKFRGISRPNPSRHLSLLRTNSLVDYFIDGRFTGCFLKEPRIPDLLKLLYKKYDDDIPAPACRPVTKKGAYPGERRGGEASMEIKLTHLSSCAG